MKTTVIIPARYASTRLPGKPILPEVKRVTGKHLIQHCYERAETAPGVSEVLVATDDRRIMRAVREFGGNAKMTDPSHTCGTDRIAEVAAEMECDLVVNIQGDEPEIQPEQITHTIELLEEDQNAEMGTLAHPIEDEKTWRDPNAVKVVTDGAGRALYFSRSPIPYVRDSEDWFSDSPFSPLKHMGIYSFRRDFLLRYAAMEPCELERAEKLEQLRALHAGHVIQVGITQTPARGIDTPQDLEQWLSKWR
ncbi:MAG: 3-deoxy-manno-octulosonate cytidylyltransferase [Planctomycetota bacterium]